MNPPGLPEPDPVPEVEGWPGFQDPGRIPRDILGQRTMFVGEVNTGKTRMTSRILKELVSTVPPDRIAVLDLAPLVPPALAARRGLTKVGGRVEIPEAPGLLVLHTRVDPPRLLGTDEHEVQALALGNRSRIRVLLDRLTASGRDVVVINDLSLFLQAGTAEELIAYLKNAQTVVANGYRGQALGAGALTVHEGREMERLLAWFDRVVELPSKDSRPAASNFREESQ